MPPVGSPPDGEDRVSPGRVWVAATGVGVAGADGAVLVLDDVLDPAGLGLGLGGGRVGRAGGALDLVLPGPVLVVGLDVADGHLVAEHQAKLDAYRADPDAYDNKGILQDAPTPEIRQRIIDGRIRHLETEISTFHFWSIDDEGLHNVYKEPTQPGIGQVSGSWDHLQDLVQGRVDTPTRHLVWLSDVLRALGTPVTREPLTPES